MNNRILKTTVLATRFFILLDIVAALFLIGLFIARLIDPSLIQDLNASIDGSRILLKTSASGVQTFIREGGAVYFYFVLIKGLFSCGILFLVLKTTLTILNSLTSISAFSKKNVQSFRKLAKLFLLWGFISIFNITNAAESAELSFTFNFKYIFYALLAMVLAEIFKEGNRLYEESKLTI